jgi:hypothetical protein
MSEIAGLSRGRSPPVIFIDDHIEHLLILLTCPLSRVILLHGGVRLLDHDPISQLLALLLDGLFQSVQEI